MAERDPGGQQQGGAGKGGAGDGGAQDGSGLGSTAKGLRQAQPLVDAVWRFVGGAVVGVLGGYFVDRGFGTSPWGLIGLSVLGIGVGFYAFVASLMRLGKGGGR
jgi:ATP synthase protein I